MRNFIQPGKVITIVAAAAVSSGSLVVAGKIFGIAATRQQSVKSSNSPSAVCTNCRKPRLRLGPSAQRFTLTLTASPRRSPPATRRSALLSKMLPILPVLAAFV